MHMKIDSEKYQAITALIMRYTGPVSGRATAPDSVIAQSIEEEMGINVSPDTIRLLRKKMGVGAYPRGGHRPGAGRKPGKQKQYKPKPTRKPQPFRKFICSREALVRWNAQEYRWSGSRCRYVYAGSGARPRDLPGSLPGWGGGSGLA